MKITFDELKEEARRQGYGLHPLMTGICTCVIGREKQISLGRKKCLRYEPIPLTGRQKLQRCKRKEDI